MYVIHRKMILSSTKDPANNNDIQFEYAEPEEDPSHQFTTVQDIIRLEENQLTCVKGILTLRPDSVQQIPMKDGYLVSMLERCTVSDDTGTCHLTLWGKPSKKSQITNLIPSQM